MLLQQLAQFDNKFLMTAANDVLFVMRIAQRCNSMCGDYMNGDFSRTSQVATAFQTTSLPFQITVLCMLCKVN